MAATLRLQVARSETERREIGARIRELRASRGFKQQYIADEIGVQLRTYQMWQAGDVVPEQENLDKLAELFGVTPQFILRGQTPDPFQPSMSDIAAMISSQSEAISQLEDQIRLLRADLQIHSAEESQRTAQADPANQLARLRQQR